MSIYFCSCIGVRSFLINDVAETMLSLMIIWWKITYKHGGILLMVADWRILFVVSLTSHFVITLPVWLSFVWMGCHMMGKLDSQTYPHLLSWWFMAPHLSMGIFSTFLYFPIFICNFLPVLWFIEWPGQSAAILACWQSISCQLVHLFHFIYYAYFFPDKSELF